MNDLKYEELWKRLFVVLVDTYEKHKDDNSYAATLKIVTNLMYSMEKEGETK